MNRVHIKRFLEFVNENEEKKWDKLSVEKNDTPTDGTITITGKGKGGKPIPENELNKEVVKDLKDVLKDDYLLKKAVTGEFKQPKFDKLIDSNLSKIRETLETAHKENRTFGKDNPNTLNHVDIKGDGLNDIFAIIPDEGKNIGKGEVLLASYYSNVKRLKIGQRGGEYRGDCGIYDNEGNLDAIIEVKSHGAPFSTASLEKVDKRTNIKIDNANVNLLPQENAVDTIKSKDLKIENYNPHIGGLALYLYGIKTSNKEDSKRPLAFVVFDNKGGQKNFEKGYNSLIFSENDGFKEIYEILRDHVKLDEKLNKKEFHIKSVDNDIILFN